MKTPHFFKAISRIGLINPPIRQKEFNVGVEDAPDFILDGNFLSSFKNIEDGKFTPRTDLLKISEFIFSKPEEIGMEKYYEVLAQELIQFKNLINRNLKENQMQIVVGGDNCVTLASILAVLERLGNAKDLGYIQFDSHGEMNSFSGSDSKNFHGMYMRALLDRFDVPAIEKISKPKLKIKQVITIGDQILDGDEPEFYKINKIRNIKRAEYLRSKSRMKKEMEGFLGKYKHIHVNFDVDIFHRSIAPATGISEDGKWMWDDVIFFIEIIRKHPSFSLDTCEINPMKKGYKKTIKVIQEVLLKFLD